MVIRFWLLIVAWGLYEWVQETQMFGLIPSPRGGHGMASIGNLLYVFGGCDVKMKCYNDLHMYDTNTGEWKRLNSTGVIPSVRGGASLLALGTNLYLFGGSDRGICYSDLFIYDAVEDSWKVVVPDSNKPESRQNHAASLDQDGNLLVFGGYSNKGYLNDIWVFLTGFNQWIKYQTSGNAPTPRELSSLNVVDNQAYLFGGFHQGGVSTQIYMLDLIEMTWFRVEDDGFLPEGREGHQTLRVVDFLFLIGGCDFGLQRCYDRIYTLDLMSMWWVKLDHPDNTPLPAQKQRAGSSIVGSQIYVFGGCYLNKHCFNDLMRIDTGVICGDNCSQNGSCISDKCVCEQGSTGNLCEIQPVCKENCRGKGLCNSIAECDCYPGYKGDLCEFNVNCPNNCTSSINGYCQPNGECFCYQGYGGSACTCNCEHGWCAGSNCICEVGWEGDLCEIEAGTQQESQIGVKVSFQTPSGDTYTINTLDTDSVPDIDQDFVGVVSKDDDADSDYEYDQDYVGVISVDQANLDDFETLDEGIIVVVDSQQYEGGSDQELVAVIDSESEFQSLGDGDDVQLVGVISGGGQEVVITDINGNPTSLDEDQDYFGVIHTDEDQDYFGVIHTDEDQGIFSSSNATLYTQRNLLSCGRNCTGHGLCRQSICYCDKEWTGEFCQVHIESAQRGISLSAALAISSGCILIGALMGLWYIRCYRKVVLRHPEQRPLIQN